MTAARFIRIGEAYDGRRFNFIVPELNSWFKYSGMVEPLKLAMEQREIKYEIKDEVVGPYKFSSFFSVNYNTRVSPSGYRVTISDPNFNAVEDRMLCRLSSLTKKRYDAIAESQRRIMLGEVNLQDTATTIRDHLMLTNASQVGFPNLPKDISAKPVLLTDDIFQRFSQTRKHILSKFDKIVPFSPRLEARAIRLCCALSTIESLRITQEKIPISNHALQLALKFYEEECQTRGLALSTR